MYKDKTICVVVPAYNEEKLIGTVLDAMPDYVDNVIVVNDGSTDKTANIAKEKGVIVITHDKNRGVGAAFRSGVAKGLELNTDIMVNIDADGQFNPRDIHKLIEPIIEGQADLVTASRFKDNRMKPEMPKIKYWGNVCMARLISFLIGQKFYDVSCGFRAYSKEALLRLNLFGKFTYTQETFLDLAFKGLTFKEIPILVKGVREHGESRVFKNLFHYGYNTLQIIFRAFRDYKPLRFFGYIAGSLLLVGFLLESLLISYYIATGSFTPYKVIGFVGGFLIGIGILVLITGFLADMLYRIRVNQEEILYQKKRELFTPKD
ncbi:MAG: glycosyltransferase family 2 protein [Candidatus Hodarchaeota archaeon]